MSDGTMKVSKVIRFTKRACIPDFYNPCPDGGATGFVVATQKRIYRVLIYFDNGKYHYCTHLIGVWKKRATTCSPLEYMVLTGRDYYTDKRRAQKDYKRVYLS